MTASNPMPWLIAQAGSREFGLNCSEVQEMVALPSVTQVPHAPAHMRGVINLRGQVLPILDLRKRLGMRPAVEEMEELRNHLRQRAQDHKNWIEELIKAIETGRDFRCTTDPHACAFGKWYDHYTTTNVMVSDILKRFDAPHKRLHAFACEALQVAREGRRDRALSMVEATKKTTLSKLLGLFEELDEIVVASMQEIAVVLRVDDQTFAVSVDSVQAVERLSEGDTAALSSLGLQADVAAAVAKRHGSDKLVITLAPSRLWG